MLRNSSGRSARAQRASSVRVIYEPTKRAWRTLYHRPDDISPSTQPRNSPASIQRGNPPRPSWLLHSQCRSITHIVDQPGGSSSCPVYYTRASAILRARSNESDVWLLHAWYLARIKRPYVNSRPRGGSRNVFSRVRCTGNEEALTYYTCTLNIYVMYNTAICSRDICINLIRNSRFRGFPPAGTADYRATNRKHFTHPGAFADRGARRRTKCTRGKRIEWGVNLFKWINASAPRNIAKSFFTFSRNFYANRRTIIDGSISSPPSVRPKTTAIRFSDKFTRYPLVSPALWRVLRHRWSLRGKNLSWKIEVPRNNCSIRSDRDSR